MRLLVSFFFGVCLFIILTIFRVPSGWAFLFSVIVLFISLLVTKPKLSKREKYRKKRIRAYYRRKYAEEEYKSEMKRHYRNK